MLPGDRWKNRREPFKVKRGEVNPQNAEAWVTQWRLTVHNMIGSIGTDDEPVVMPEDLVALTYRITLWCDLGYCNVDPEPLSEMIRRLTAFTRCMTYVAVNCNRTKTASSCKEYLPTVMGITSRMASVARYLNTGEVEPYVQTTKAELSKLLDISNGTLRDWLDSHASDIREKTRTAKKLQIKSRLYEKLLAAAEGKTTSKS